MVRLESPAGPEKPGGAVGIDEVTPVGGPDISVDVNQDGGNGGELGAAEQCGNEACDHVDGDVG